MSIANPYLHSNDPQSVHHARLKKWATVASLSVATLLIVFKFFAYMRTDSVSMLSSLMDSAFDWMASLATMISVAHAASPADEDHRFGHGKVEALTALGQAIFIFGSSIYLIFESLHRFMQPVRIQDPKSGLIIMALSMFLTGLLVIYQRYVIKKTSSIAISADHLHYKGDLFMNAGVFSALAWTYYSPWPYFDPIVSLIIALCLLYGAREITKESFDVLMDKELPEDQRAHILDIVKQHRDVKSAHNLRTRTTGTRDFIEFHVELDRNMSLYQSHEITEELEKKLYESFPKAEVIIHQEPEGHVHHKLDDVLESK